MVVDPAEAEEPLVASVAVLAARAVDLAAMEVVWVAKAETEDTVAKEAGKVAAVDRCQEDMAAAKAGVATMVVMVIVAVVVVVFVAPSSAAIFWSLFQCHHTKCGCRKE